MIDELLMIGSVMRTVQLLGSASCAAVAIAIAMSPSATAEPITDVLRNSESSQFRAAPDRDCHSSYEPCVPIVSDVDCEGVGDGPVYTGPVRVIGPDEYGLDRDGNGLGCEPS